MTLGPCPTCRRCDAPDCEAVGACMDQPGDGPCDHDQIRCADHPCEACAEAFIEAVRYLGSPEAKEAERLIDRIVLGDAS